MNAVNQELIDRRAAYVNLNWEGGRATSAPTLDGFKWEDWKKVPRPPATDASWPGLLSGRGRRGWAESETLVNWPGACSQPT
eukprot:10024342-Alexandrium_andersonii.AAC.1